MTPAARRASAPLALLAAWPAMACAQPACAGDAPARAMEQAQRDEVNLARTAPADYAELLRAYFAGMDARGGYLLQGARVQSAEGRKAVDEAVAFLRRATPRAPLQPGGCLGQAAQAHADDQARSGAVGHQGSDGSSLDDRVRRHGVRAWTCGENIAYGQPSARDVVVALLVDDGVPSRGHRANLFDAGFTRLGVGQAVHPRYGVVTVQVLCGPQQPG